MHLDLLYYCYNNIFILGNVFCMKCAIWFQKARSTAKDRFLEIQTFNKLICAVSNQKQIIYHDVFYIQLYQI